MFHSITSKSTLAMTSVAMSGAIAVTIAILSATIAMVVGG